MSFPGAKRKTGRTNERQLPGHKRTKQTESSGRPQAGRAVLPRNWGAQRIRMIEAGAPAIEFQNTPKRLTSLVPGLSVAQLILL
jgi:hypothetical protein